MDEAVTKQQALAQVERGLTRAVLALAHACESQKVHAYGADYEAASQALATLRAFIESQPSAPRAEAVEAQKPAAYLTRDEEGEPEMLFFDLQEARTYCYPDDEPEPLFLRVAAIAQGAVEGDKANADQT